MNLEKTKKWAMDIMNEYDIKQKRKKLIENVAMQKAKKIFKDKTGQDMSNNRMNMESQGMMMSRDAKEYLNNKKNIGNKLKTKMKQRGVL